MTPEKPDLAKIPGVSRGFPKGESIEAGRERLSARLRAQMPEDRVDLILVSEAKKGFLNYPHLGPENIDEDKAPFWIPRYEPASGALHITRWGEFGGNNEKYVVVRKPVHAKNINLDKIPQSWETAVLIPQRYRTIEDAMRTQDEIRHDYGVNDGVEQDEVETLLSKIFQMTEVFQHQDEVSTNTLTELADKSFKIFDVLGISGPKSAAKERLITSMLRAARPDKLGRVNPMVSRILYRSAYLNAVRREVIARLSREKSNRIFWLLLVERQGSRSSLVNAKEAIARLAGFGNEPGHPILTESLFATNPRKISDEDITDIRAVLNGIAQTSLLQVRVSPYMQSARICEALLTSESFRKRNQQQLLRETLLYYDLASELSGPSAEDSIMARRPVETVARLRHAYGVLEAVLNDPDNREYTVF